MAAKAFQHDMTMMFAMHDALRRELMRISRISAHTDRHPQQVITFAPGWEMFKSYLRVHHTSEDEALWPVMAQELAGQPDDLALLAAMETEHAAIDPLLNAIDADLRDRGSGRQRLGDLADALVTTLTGHLRHEEKEALPLIDATLTPSQWQHFTELHRARIGADIPRYLPWLLDDASEANAAAVLVLLPENVRHIYHDAWHPAYSQLNLWPDRNEQAGD